MWGFIFSNGLNYRFERRVHEIKRHKLLGISKTFTSLVLQISIAIHLENLVSLSICSLFLIWISSCMKSLRVMLFLSL
jgi:hypothetical protein